MRIISVFLGLIFLFNIHTAEASNNEPNEADENFRSSFNAMGVLDSVVDVDFSDRTVVIFDQKASILEDTDSEDSDSYLSADDLYEKLEEQTQEGAAHKRVHILSLAKTAMDDAAFAEVTNKLVSSITFENNNNSILDLSFNGLTPSSA